MPEVAGGRGDKRRTDRDRRPGTRATAAVDDGFAELRKLMRVGAGPGSPWIAFDVDKPSGGKRRITAPRARLREIQRAILRQILDKVPAHPAAHGFVAGRSVASNARAHAGAAVVVKLDLVDFFPTIHYRRVAGLFRSLGYGGLALGTSIAALFNAALLLVLEAASGHRR